MSVNSSLSSDDALLQTRSLGTIAAGATVSTTLTGTIPSGAPAGVYYMILVVDPNGAVAESNEGNNTLVRAITVR
jgi:subtilase family serine protease